MKGGKCALAASLKGSELNTLKPDVRPQQKHPASWLKARDSRSGKGLRCMTMIAIRVWDHIVTCDGLACQQRGCPGFANVY